MAAKAFWDSQRASELEVLLVDESSSSNNNNNNNLLASVRSADAVILGDDFHQSGASLLDIDTDDPNANLVTTKRKKIKRSKTAPTMAILKALSKEVAKDKDTTPSDDDSNRLAVQAGVLLLIYLFFGVVIYSFNRHHFSGHETHPIVDALYFSIVTMCTIGYGDIAPTSAPAKLFACVFVLVGFGFIDILLSGVLNYVLDMQENMILRGSIKASHGKTFSARDYIVDSAKGRMRIRLKVGLALGVVVLCIGIGALVLHSVERLNWIDSAYLAVMSVTTVGYGDKAFKSLTGRLFASVWLLLSTLAVARAFIYLAEARIDKRNRRISNWALHRAITIDDLFAADINNSGFLSKSEYVIFKLKEMGKIDEKDIRQIVDQFDKLDRYQSGKITLPDLLADPA